MKADIVPSVRDPLGFDLRVSFLVDEITDEREIAALKASGWRYFVDGNTVKVDIPL